MSPGSMPSTELGLEPQQGNAVRRAEEGRGAPEPPGSHASRVQLRPTVVPSSSIPQRRASGTRLVPSSGTVTWGVCRVALHLDDILILT